MGKGVIFTTILIAWFGINLTRDHVVASLDKTLYNDYLCLTAFEQATNSGVQECKKILQEHWITGYF